MPTSPPLSGHPPVSRAAREVPRVAEVPGPGLPQQASLCRGTDAPVGVIAHRGNSSVAPENTLAAFESARRAGGTWVETDLRRSRDGVPVVIHDPDLDATTDGRGGVAGWSARDLERLDAGSWFSPAYAGAQLPLLPALLTWASQHPDVKLLLELKGVWAAEEVRTVVDLVRGCGAASRTVLQSFAQETVAQLALQAPELPRGLLLQTADPALDALVRDLGVVAVNPGIDLLLADPDLVTRLQRQDVAVCPWTVDDPEAWALLDDLGVDAVITNRPDRMLGWLDGRASARTSPLDAVSRSLPGLQRHPVRG